MTGRTARRFFVHALVAGLAVTLLGSTFAAAAGATTVPWTSSPTGPSQAQINTTKDQIANIEATIVHEQQQSAALSQQYDAAEQQVQEAQSALQATQASLVKTRSEITRDRARMARAAVRAYVYGSGATQVPVLFTSSSGAAAARGEYETTAIGDLASARDALVTAQATLVSLQAQQRDEEQKAQQAATQAKNLQQQNAANEQAAQATLQQVQGTLAAQVAKYAQVQAEKAAAAAAAARAQAARERAAQEAAQEAAVAAALGNTQASQAANQAANQAASSADTGANGATIGASGTSSSAGNAAVAAAESQLGVPYVWGGETPGVGFDCSGLTQWAWAQAGVSIPRTSEIQWTYLPHVALSSLQPGDLLFYYNLDADHAVDHVVMYVGSGPYGSHTIIQAPFTGATVSYAALFTYGLIGAARP